MCISISVSDCSASMYVFKLTWAQSWSAHEFYDVFHKSNFIRNFLKFYSTSPSTVFVPCVCTWPKRTSWSGKKLTSPQKVGQGSRQGYCVGQRLEWRNGHGREKHKISTVYWRRGPLEGPNTSTYQGCYADRSCTDTLSSLQIILAWALWYFLTYGGTSREKQ